MSHSCSASLCVSPHYANDSHSEFCLCDMCHPEHDWQALGYYPDDCEGCLDQLSQWIHENTDLKECAIPEHCTYWTHKTKGKTI